MAGIYVQLVSPTYGHGVDGHHFDCGIISNFQPFNLDIVFIDIGFGRPAHIATAAASSSIRYIIHYYCSRLLTIVVKGLKL